MILYYFSFITLQQTFFNAFFTADEKKKISRLDSFYLLGSYFYMPRNIISLLVLCLKFYARVKKNIIF